MKNLIIAVIAFATLTLQAQKKIQKEINYKDQSVEMEFAFASGIEIKSWDKPTIRIEAIAETNDEKYTDMFELKLQKDASKIKVSSNSGDIFKAYQKEKEGLAMLYDKSLDHEFKYILFLPKNVRLDISSITGSIASEFVQGNITAELISGDIDIKEYKGDLKLKTISGEINLNYMDSSLIAKTITGDIHTNNSQKLIRKNKLVGEEVSIQLGYTQNSLTLHTISGDIYLK